MGLVVQHRIQLRLLLRIELGQNLRSNFGIGSVHRRRCQSLDDADAGNDDFSFTHSRDQAFEQKTAIGAGQ